MKEYKRQFRTVFSNKKRYEDYLKKDRIDFLEGKPASLLQFTNKMRELMWSSELESFNVLVKFVWLRGRLKYKGVSSIFSTKGKGCEYNRAVTLLFNNDVSFHQGNFMNNGSGWKRHVVTYFKDFYPNFFDDDPFETEYKYPYKYMNLECLFAVYMMEDRLELLRIGEKEKMTYGEFLDYVLNHVYCINDELDYRKYRFVMSHVTLPYVTLFKEKKYARKRKRRKSKANSVHRGREDEI